VKSPTLAASAVQSSTNRRGGIQGVTLGAILGAEQCCVAYLVVGFGRRDRERQCSDVESFSDKDLMLCWRCKAGELDRPA
jgi:hypothetical protein